MNSLSAHQGWWPGIASGSRAWSAGFLVAIVVGVSGCAGIVSGSPEQVVKERAQARWDALVKGDVKTAYGYLSPGTRAVTTLKTYETSVSKGFWKSANVGKVECRNTDNCEVSGTIRYTFQGQEISTPFRETWIKSESEWWYVPK